MTPELELYHLIRQLAVIPAPSGKEEKRAAYCLDWFHQNHLDQAFIDGAGNVVVELKADKRSPASDYIVFMAHMDLVFPDQTPLPLVEKEGIIHCPGIMDNTANLAVLMMTARHMAQAGPDCNMLFVCSVGEEGLGNLKGVRKICQDYAGRIKAFYAYDLTYDQYTVVAVGSLRYEARLTTPGGHSFLDFGKPNANLLMSRFVCGFYELSIPQWGHTTYNVGLQKGGTSVNTIAQESAVLLEMRSDCYESLTSLHQNFLAYVKDWQEAMPEGCSLQITCIGDRPCEKDVDPDYRRAMFRQVEDTVRDITGTRPRPIPCSTDCNIPLSLGIPSVCVGTCLGAGAHTREEWAQTASFSKGLEIGIQLAKSSLQIK